MPTEVSVSLSHAICLAPEFENLNLDKLHLQPMRRVQIPCFSVMRSPCEEKARIDAQARCRSCNYGRTLVRVHGSKLQVNNMGGAAYDSLASATLFRIAMTDITDI